MVDKARCWEALALSMWFNENADFFYKHLYGDKETFHLAFCKTRTPFSLVPTPIHTLPGTMCQHDLQGHRLFQHRNRAKWSLAEPNPRIPDFWLEDVCLEALDRLSARWDGRIRSDSRKRTRGKQGGRVS